MLNGSAQNQQLTDIVQPSRLGKGKFMKVAKVKQEKWLGLDDDKIDSNKALSILENYQKFLSSLASQ